MLSVKDLWKLALILIGIFHNTQGAWLRCYNGALDNVQVVPLYKPEQLLNTTCINLAHPTVFYTFGYRGKVAGPATTSILSAYLATKKRNVVLLDWEDDASSGILGLPLGYAFSAVPSAIKIGADLGEALVKLARSGMNMTQMHLIGHSLGAHLMAYAGRHTRENGLVVARITGLDPARALFEDNNTLSNSEFAEYYLDYKQIQNMTNFEKIRTATNRNLCSHDRSWRYFVQSIVSPTDFSASYAKDYDSWVENAGRSDRTTYLGDLTNTR
ncbi:hypothetical protein MSG28_006340 [Choristoneura fumiferana]|uniref:Uncharacterized protein n=1 Tax=Choristoneura fumiferana TaxID=7141 RepID=A0ACC0JES3_CHOFU|nr:hypothetical protein MSG28_006340 [Choristoneura fumiferana]